MAWQQLVALLAAGGVAIAAAINGWVTLRNGQAQRTAEHEAAQATMRREEDDARGHRLELLEQRYDDLTSRFDEERAASQHERAQLNTQLLREQQAGNVCKLAVLGLRHNLRIVCGALETAGIALPRLVEVQYPDTPTGT